ncbi:hypothetical protein [Salinispira pacifica]|nr:hypothetical protein [Salinispira pacifica]
MLIRKQGRPPEFTREPVYARHASLAFNRRMHKILQDLCREIATELSGKLHAVILGGNYGRGEGGLEGLLKVTAVASGQSGKLLRKISIY